jgi:hypothetical protein
LLEIAATAGEPTCEFCESSRQERFARIEIAKNEVASVSPPLKRASKKWMAISSKRTKVMTDQGYFEILTCHSPPGQ